MQEKLYRVIIAGSRSFQDYETLKQKCDYYLQSKEKIAVICGMARGADMLGRRYAQEKGFPCIEYPADWKKYGKCAGYIRNRQMAQTANALLAFWDGESRGTKNMIELAEEYGLDMRVIKY